MRSERGDDIAAWLTLALAHEVGPTLARRALEAFGSPSALLSASPDAIRSVGGWGPNATEGLLSARTRERARLEIERAERIRVRILPLDAPDYPESLRALANPPLVLYVFGRIAPADALAVAVVGTRRACDYGRTMARTIAGELAACGLAIVSGLASGIDGEAHRAALDAEGGRTIAVLGQGFDTPIYPAHHRKLAARIVEEDRGAIVSAFPLGATPHAALFPQRNAIVAGLACGTLVVEAGERSGALGTAGHCADLGRPVMACPGDATRPNARGSNRLIADGAAMVQETADVWLALEPELRAVRARLGMAEPAATPSDPPAGEKSATDADAVPDETPLSGEGADTPASLEALLRDILTRDRRPTDFVLEACSDAGYGRAEVVGKLFSMELAGVVRKMPGGIYEWAK